MQEQDPVYDYVRQLMIEVMAVLRANGHTQLHVGAMMRLIGVTDELACKHDDERVQIDEEFDRIAKDLNIEYLIQTKPPAGATIH